MSPLADRIGAGYMHWHKVHVVSGAMPRPVLDLLKGREEDKCVRHKEQIMFVIAHIGSLHQW